MDKPALTFSWTRDCIWGLLLFAATFLAYQPAWNGQPLWDDDGHLTKPELRPAAGLARIWTELGATQQYYPLVHTVFWVEHRLFGDSTPGYHLINILLHLISALLLVTVLRRLGISGAWLAGGIFALHPVMVESVAWITELKNTLSGVFFFGAALAYLKFDCTRKKKHFAIAFMLFILGLCAKSVIVALPAALLVVFWWRRGKIELKRDVAPLLPFLAVGIISGLVTAWVERKFIGATGGEFSFTVLDRCLIAGRVVWFYLSKVLWPANLIFMYPRWHIDSAAAWQYLFPGALLLAVALFWVLRNRSRAPLALLLYFTIALFPALGFFNVYPFRYSFVADHFQYLASLGPITAAAACMTKGTGLLQERLRLPAQRLLYGTLLSLLFILTWEQCGMYSNAETLYKTTIAKNDCWWAHNNLALLYTDLGRTDDARTQYLKVLEFIPNDIETRNNLSVLLAKMGRTDEALAHYRKALEINPDHSQTHSNLGVLLARMGRTDEALAHYQKALETNPNSAEAHYNLGLLFANMGRPEDALAQYQMVVGLNPKHVEAHNNLGLLLANMGRTDEALAHYRKALEINPNHTEAHNNIGVLLENLGRNNEALAHYQRALEISPNAGNVHNNLGFLLAEMGRTDEAVAHYRKALEISPGYAATRNNLGVLLAEKGRLDEAIVQYRKAWELDPGELSGLKNLAVALAQNGNWNDANSVLQNALASARSAGENEKVKVISQILGDLRKTVEIKN